MPGGITTDYYVIFSILLLHFCDFRIAPELLQCIVLPAVLAEYVRDYSYIVEQHPLLIVFPFCVPEIFLQYPVNLHIYGIGNSFNLLVGTAGTYYKEVSYGVLELPEIQNDNIQCLFFLHPADDNTAELDRVNAPFFAGHSSNFVIYLCRQLFLKSKLLQN